MWLPFFVLRSICVILPDQSHGMSFGYQVLRKREGVFILLLMRPNVHRIWHKTVYWSLSPRCLDATVGESEVADNAVFNTLSN